jgi:hypothetical protein
MLSSLLTKFLSSGLLENTLNNVQTLALKLAIPFKLDEV